MMNFSTFTVACVLVLCCTAVQSRPHRTGRLLLAQNLRTTQSAITAAQNATGTGRQSLALFGTPSATLIRLVDYALLAHSAAEEMYTSAPAGQVSATLGSAAAAGASLLATTAALANDSAARAQASQALNAADSYIRAIQDENPLQVTNATLANLALLTNLAHDGTLTQYWQNATAGVRGDNETFADTLSAVPDLVDTAETELAAGSSPALALLTMEIAVRNILGAISVFNGDNAAAFAQGVAESRVILKAVNAYKGAVCTGDVTAAVTAVKAALAAAETAASSPTTANIQALSAAATTALTATSCNAVSPSIAPAPATSQTATGG